MLMCIIAALLLLLYLQISQRSEQASSADHASPANTTPAVRQSNTPEIQTQANDQQPATVEDIAADKARYIKMDSAGELLDDDEQQWDCVMDNNSGLVWEVKKTDGGVQDKDFTFVWFEDSNLGAIPQAPPNEGRCFYIACYTSAYIEALNDRELCGVDQWRLPSQQELATLDHPTQFDPDIDNRYFPNTVSAEYWSSTQPKNSDTLAISVDFKNGFPYVSEKRLPYRVRLVSKPATSSRKQAGE